MGKSCNTGDCLMFLSCRVSWRLSCRVSCWLTCRMSCCLSCRKSCRLFCWVIVRGEVFLFSIRPPADTSMLLVGAMKDSWSGSWVVLGSRVERGLKVKVESCFLGFRNVFRGV